MPGAELRQEITAGSRTAPSTHYKVSNQIEGCHHLSSVGNVKSAANLDSGTGVMRFLQTEWHRHERERNAWQIERAEMKSRIGKLEGDGRTNKRLRESMDKHIRLLEHALKKEREKAKAPQSESQTEDKNETSQASKQNVRPTSKGSHISVPCICW